MLENYHLQVLQPELRKVTRTLVRTNYVSSPNCKGMGKCNPSCPGKRRTLDNGQHQKSLSTGGLSHMLSALPLDEKQRCALGLERERGFLHIRAQCKMSVNRIPFTPSPEEMPEHQPRELLWMVKCVASSARLSRLEYQLLCSQVAVGKRQPSLCFSVLIYTIRNTILTSEVCET